MSRNSDNCSSGFFGFTEGYFIAVILLVVGWFLNAIQITQMVSDSQWGWVMVVKVVAALLAPIGGVLGWVGLFV